MPVKMEVPEGATSCSYAGEVFESVDGVVTVPQGAVADLQCHGFTVIKMTFDDADSELELANAEAARQQAIADLEGEVTALQGKLAKEKNDDSKLILSNQLVAKEAALAALKPE